MDPQLQTQPQPANPPLPPPKPRLSLLLGGLFLSLFILVGSYMVFGTKQSVTPIPSVSQQLPTTIPTIDPTVNWKTIDGVGYKFKIPQDWMEKEPYNNQTHLFTTNVGEIEMWIHTKISNTSLEEWFINDLTVAPGYDKSIYVLSTVSGKKFLNNSKLGQVSIYALEINDTKVLQIGCGVGCKEKQFKELLNQILSTFTFLDQSQKSSNDFKKRMFDVGEKFFKTQNYPTELVNINENKLVGIRCSEQYLYQYQELSYAYYDETSKQQIKLTDNKLIGLIDQIKNAYAPENIAAIMYCDSEDGRSIFAYETHGGGGGMNNVAYFGLINNSGLNLITNVPNDGGPYRICPNPLQLTTNNIFYWNCIAGDGGYGASTIYAIDLNKNNFRNVLKCVSQVQSETEQPTLTCE